MISYEDLVLIFLTSNEKFLSSVYGQIVTNQQSLKQEIYERIQTEKNAPVIDTEE